MASHSISIGCSADTYTYVQSQGSNYGSSTVMCVGKEWGDVGQYAAFLGFDISSIPKNKTIKNISMVFRLNAIINTGGSLSNDTSWPVVIRARRVYDYDFATIESTLNLNTVVATKGEDDFSVVCQGALDTSLNISALAGNVIGLNIRDITRIADDKIMVAILLDGTYGNIRSSDCYATISSREGSYAPSLLIEYDDYVSSAPINISPNNVVRNKGGTTNLSWQFIDEFTGATQALYEIAYSSDNFATTTTVTGSTASTHAIPANTFTSGNVVKWKVRVTDSNGEVSAWSEIATVTMGTTLPSAPAQISPVNTTVNSSDEIYFRWKFIDTYGYSQGSYDLQYRKGTGTETTVSATTVNQYHKLNAKVLVGGDYSWRVRCYNTFGEIGAYSEWSSFYSIGQPELPSIISASNSMNPLVKWTSNEQDLFVIKLYKDNTLIFNSGEQASKEVNEYKIEDYLNDGAYRVGLQISNVYGLWSSEAFYTFTVSTVKPLKPTMVTGVNSFYIALIINSTTAVNLIYRKGDKDIDYVLIDTLTINTLADYAATAGTNQYFVRAVTSDSFNDSDIVTVSLSFKGIVLAGAENQSNLINLYLTKDSDRRKSISLMKIQSKVYCNGREYPVSQSTLNKNHSENHEYFIKPNQYDIFLKIVNDNNTFLYRNNYGYAFVMELSNLTILEDVFGYNVTFTLTRLEE